MSILNNLKDFFIPAEVEDDNETSYKRESAEPENTESSYSGSSSASSSAARRESYTSQYEERRASGVSAGVSSSTGGNTSGSASYRTVRAASPTLQVILVKPTEYTDAKKIADHLMNNRTVVLVLEDATEATRRRIIDFLIGVAYAMNGNLKPIANQTYIVTPHDVGLVDQLVSELQVKGYSSDMSDSVLR